MHPTPPQPAHAPPPVLLDGRRCVLLGRPPYAFAQRPTRVYEFRREVGVVAGQLAGQLVGPNVVVVVDGPVGGPKRSRVLGRRDDLLGGFRRAAGEHAWGWGPSSPPGERRRLAFDLLCDAAGPAPAAEHYRGVAAWLARVAAPDNPWPACRGSSCSG